MEVFIACCGHAQKQRCCPIVIGTAQEDKHECILVCFLGRYHATIATWISKWMKPMNKCLLVPWPQQRSSGLWRSRWSQRLRLASFEQKKKRSIYWQLLTELTTHFVGEQSQFLRRDSSSKDHRCFWWLLWPRAMIKCEGSKPSSS